MNVILDGYQSTVLDIGRRKKRHGLNFLQMNFTLPIDSSYRHFHDLSSPANIVEKALKTCEEFGLKMTDSFIWDKRFCDIGQVLNYEHNKCGKSTDFVQEVSCWQGYQWGDCSLGWYYDWSRQQCIICPRGYYQNNINRMNCIPCPNGLTTEQSGAVDKGQCVDTCPLGQELGVSEECIFCPKGTYRDIDMTACTTCPYGYTTERDGSPAVDYCTLVECPSGSYLTNTSGCSFCPLGTYQPNKGTAKCIACPPSKTTERRGAVLLTQCIPMTDAPCMSHHCHEIGGECINVESHYVCRCITGWTGDGRNCIMIDQPTSNKTIVTTICCSVLAISFILVIVIAIFYRFRPKTYSGSDSFQKSTDTRAYPSGCSPFGRGNYLSQVYSFPRSNHVEPTLYANFKR
ncbi:hypothetical protein LSH36_26g06001 [Paralvinella palmiformis]|uniref:EGF-like domain-containing protein n=1 Tax=Paralvinella palmiformis TaxID=53620 RepID=A0AAD9KBE5_9ANNE|nr:hypothetical protein LSH36_26g06001 [Paralvinella palmiformis]